MAWNTILPLLFHRLVAHTPFQRPGIHSPGFTATSTTINVFVSTPSRCWGGIRNGLFTIWLKTLNLYDFALRLVQPNHSISNRWWSKPLPFNDTLLRFAADAKLKKEIEDLLEGNFASSSFLSSGKYHIDVRLRTARGMPLQLRSPEFHRNWQKLLRHLSDWARNQRFFHPDIMPELVNEIKSSICEWGSVIGNHPREEVV